MANPATFSPSIFYARPRHLTAGARAEILRILGSSLQPLTTKEIRSLIRGRVGGLVVLPNEPPKPYDGTGSKRTGTENRPLDASELRYRSYLKKIALPQLTRTKEIERLRIQKWLPKAEIERRLKQVPDALRHKAATKLSGPQYVWYWQLAQPKPPTPTKKSVPSDIDSIPKAASGIGLDMGHLGKRRQEKWKKRMEADLQVMLARLRAKRAQSELEVTSEERMDPVLSKWTV